MSKIKILEKYYASNFDRLVKAWEKRAGSVMDSEDLIQEAFARAIKYIDGYDESKPFEGWFITILSNCHRAMSSEKRRMGMSIDLQEADEMGLLDPVVMDTSHPRLLKAVNTLISKSNRPAKDVLFLYFSKQWSPREIGVYLGLELSAVRKSIGRFKQTLRGLVV